MAAETYSPYELASMADCASPDSLDSPGARFLLEVADACRELVTENPGSSADDLRDSVSEIADGAPDVYTYARWQEFVDLGAWNEDLSELGCDGDDMTQAAAVCLYMIAERLAVAVIEDLLERADDDDDDDDD
jgi:hypothetical protein